MGMIIQGFSDKSLKLVKRLTKIEEEKEQLNKSNVKNKGSSSNSKNP